MKEDNRECCIVLINHNIMHRSGPVSVAEEVACG